MRLLIIGPQGAGKGTQAAVLTQALAIPHISTGDLFRANISQGTTLGLKVKELLDTGALVPDEVTQDMLAARLDEPDATAGFLLDGFPRTTPQATWLEAELERRGTPIQSVIVLEAADEVLRERMLARGRGDDTPESIDRRLALYHSETRPLLEFYADRAVHVDGVGGIDEVAGRIRSALDSAAV